MSLFGGFLLDKQQSLFAAWVSVISNICLTILKIISGVVFKSQVLLADGIHNAADVVASAVSLGSMKISNQPADEDHHMDMESRSCIFRLCVHYFNVGSSLYWV